MSAQLIAALRRRADVLETHAATGIPPRLTTISEAMIEAVFKEWEAAHPGQNARAMGSSEFADRLMEKFAASGRKLPRGTA